MSYGNYRNKYRGGAYPPVVFAPQPMMLTNNRLRSRPSRRQRASGKSGYRSKWASLSTRSDPVYPKPEVKNLDTTLGDLDTPLPVDSTGSSVFELSQLAQGVTDTGRIGRKIAVKNIYYQFVCQFGTDGEEPLVFRHILYWDRQPNGAAVGPTTVSQLLQSQPYVTSPMNLDNNQRFVILSDDRTTLSPNGDQIRIWTGFRKINQFALYNDSNDIAQSGALRVLFVSDVSTTSTPPGTPPFFYGTWRMRFIDN